MQKIKDLIRRTSSQKPVSPAEPSVHSKSSTVKILANDTDKLIVLIK